jgi:hypothetical protein
MWLSDQFYEPVAEPEVVAALYENKGRNEPHHRLFDVPEAAQGPEARRAETVKQGSVHDGPVA